MARPAALGAEFEIASLADADLVLAELAFLDHREREVLDATNCEIAAAKSRALDQLVVTVSGSPVTIAERRDRLTSRLESWIETDLATQLTDKKSVALANGTIGFRRNAERVTLPVGATDKDFFDSFEKLTKGKKGVQGWIAATMARLNDSVIGLGSVGDLLRVKIEINWTAIRQGYRDKKILPEALAKLGLIAVESRDVPYISPNEFVVEPK